MSNEKRILWLKQHTSLLFLLAILLFSLFTVFLFWRGEEENAVLPSTRLLLSPSGERREEGSENRGGKITEEDVQKKTARGGQVIAEEKQGSADGEKRKQHFPVCLSGAVKNPGVYEMEEGSYLSQALEKAGGPAEGADLRALNLAQKLKANELYYIPSQEEGSPIPSTFPHSVQEEEEKIDINSASEQELLQVPGIGPKTATAICRYREEHGKYQNLEDLMQVPGIKRHRYEQILPKLCLR